MPRDVPVAAGAASRADATLPSCESTLANEPIAATEWQCREAESPHEMDWKVLSPSFTRRALSQICDDPSNHFRFRFRALTARHTPTSPGEASVGGAHTESQTHTDKVDRELPGLRQIRVV